MVGARSPRKRNVKTKAIHLQEMAAKYRRSGQPWPATSRMIAAWAIRTGEWVPNRKSLIDIAAQELSRALREDFKTDDQGRRVRKMHAIREAIEQADGHWIQQVLWVDIDDAEPLQMHRAFQQRRQQIKGDCRQLKVDVDSYNDNNRHGAEIQMHFDFTDDLSEMEQPTEYEGIKS